MNYKDLLILRLSNLTEWKNEKEMIIPEEMRKDFRWATSCEFLGDGKYILRDYRENGNKRWEDEYQNGQLHGRSIDWKRDGNKLCEQEYNNGKLHRKVIDESSCNTWVRRKADR